jgi:O-antigen ligase
MRTPLFETLARLEIGLSYREYLWQAALKIINENPLFGTGPGTFADYSYCYMEPSLGRTAIGISKFPTHNVILNIASDMGIMAALLMISYWFFVIIYFFINATKVKSTSLFSIYLGCGAVFIGMIGRAMFESGGNFMMLIVSAMIFRIVAFTRLKHEVVGEMI